MTLFDGRVASLADREVCGHSWARRFWLNAGVVCDRKVLPPHPEYLDYGRRSVLRLYTDDEAEAEAAYARAQEWVLHEVLPND
jgi:hypothetical protein